MESPRNTLPPTRVVNPRSPLMPSRSAKPSASATSFLSMHNNKYKDSMTSPAKLIGGPVPLAHKSAKSSASKSQSPVKRAIDVFEKRARGSPELYIPELHSSTTEADDATTTKEFDLWSVNDKRPSLATRRSILLDPLKADPLAMDAIPETLPEYALIDVSTPENEEEVLEENVLEGVPDDVEFDLPTIGDDVDSLRQKVTQLEQAYTRLREKEALQRRLHGARSRECRALLAQIRQQHMPVPFAAEHKVNDLLAGKYRAEESHWRKMKAMNRVFGGKRAMSMPATSGAAPLVRSRSRATSMHTPSTSKPTVNAARCYRCGDHRNRRIGIDVRKEEENKAETSVRRNNIYVRAEFCIGCFQCVKCDASLLPCVDDMALCEFGGLCSATCGGKEKQRRPPVDESES